MQELFRRPSQYVNASKGLDTKMMDRKPVVVLRWFKQSILWYLGLGYGPFLHNPSDYVKPTHEVQAWSSYLFSLYANTGPSECN
jgi:hypothetical protein